MTYVCPNCGSDNTSWKVEASSFLYGVRDPVRLQVTEPVITCGSCGESWTDYRGEAARVEAVERYRRAFQSGGVQRARRMICVFGGRDFNGVAILNSTLVVLHTDLRFTHLLHGGADGADTLADEWARLNGVQPVACDALWPYYKVLNRARAAGVIRNGKMIELEPEYGLCCPGGKGTADMLAKFKHYMTQRPSARLFEMDMQGMVTERYT